MLSDEDGSAPLEAIFAMALLLILVLGLIQIAFVLYGRNVVVSSAHEGARAAVELGRNPVDAATVAERTVRSASGDMVKNLDVDVSVRQTPDRSLISVSVSGSLDSFGPIPVSVPVRVSATGIRDDTLR